MPDLVFVTLSYAHHHDGGVTDWIAHVAISSVIHVAIHGLLFRLMYQLTFFQGAVLVVLAFAVGVVWAGSHNRRGQ